MAEETLTRDDRAAITGPAESSQVAPGAHPAGTDVLPALRPLLNDSPAEFALVVSDDSMASKYPKGSTFEFSTVERDPRAGDAVLVADTDDNVFFRQYQQRRPGHWQAVALNVAYQPLDSKADALRMLAIKVAARWRDG